MYTVVRITVLDSFKSTYGRYSFAALVHCLLMGFKVPSVLNLPLTMSHIGQAMKENPGYHFVNVISCLCMLLINTCTL